MRCKRSRWWILIMIISMGLYFCGAGPALAAPPRGGTVIEAIGTEPTNLDCFKARRRPERTILHLILEPLFVTNPNLEVEPLLVKSWKVSKDNRTWTFVLKGGIKFHDGTELGAEDVKYSLERHMKGSQAARLKGIEKISVIDSKTFQIKLTKPNPSFITSLASSDLGIISKEACEKAGPAWGSKVIVGTGPLKFKEWVSGDRVILLRNTYYRHGPAWLSNRGPAYVDKWVIRFIPEPAILVGELTSGEVDLSDYVTERDVRRVQSNPNTGLILAKSTSAIYLAINCAANNKPFNDVKIRSAMAHAVNAQAVRKAAMAGIGEPLYTPFAPTTMGFWKKSEEIGKPITKYDPELAKRLLAQAGWKDTDGDGFVDKDGKPLVVNFLAFTIARYRRMAEVATPMLQKVGFKVDLKILEAGDLYERVLKGRHDLLSTGLVASQGIILDDMFDTMHSGSIGSITQWCFYNDPKMDELLEKAKFAPDPKQRQEALREAQELAASEVPVVPIALAMEIFGYKKKTIGGVENYTKHPWCFDQVDAYRALEIYKKK